MPIPTYDKFMLPLLRIASDGAPHRIRDLDDRLASDFSISEGERLELVPSGKHRVFHNRIDWAKTYLKKAGLIDSPKRGWMQITQRGREVLKCSLPDIDIAFLKRFEEFREFLDKSTVDPVVGPTPPEPTTSTPEEAIEKASDQLQKKLASELLDTLKACSPYFFEKVVLRLLQAMGYGGLRTCLQM